MITTFLITLTIFVSAILLMILTSIITKKELKGSCSNKDVLKKIDISCEVCPNSKEDLTHLATLGYNGHRKKIKK